MNIADGPLPRYDSDMAPDETLPRNVLGSVLEVCCESPLTGFFRDGLCRTGHGDLGVHVVCAVMTEEFLGFSGARGNDLVTPDARHGFPGLRAGDRWCLCAGRWKEALDAGLAPPVVLEATAVSALEFVSLAQLRRFALGEPGPE
jgi:uncharacterized protein (DUF2237 family)